MKYRERAAIEWDVAVEATLLDRPHNNPLTWQHVLMMSGDYGAASAAHRLVQSGASYEDHTGEVNPEW